MAGHSSVYQGLGFRVQGSVVIDLPRHPQVPGPMSQAPGPETLGPRSRVPGPMSQVPGSRSQVLGPMSWVPCFRVPGSRFPGRRTQGPCPRYRAPDSQYMFYFMFLVIRWHAQHQPPALGIHRIRLPLLLLSGPKERRANGMRAK